MADQAMSISEQIASIRNTANKKKQKLMTRKKILIGANILEKIKNDEIPKITILACMDSFLTRDRDRLAFGLKPFPKSTEKKVLFDPYNPLPPLEVESKMQAIQFADDRQKDGLRKILIGSYIIKKIQKGDLSKGDILDHLDKYLTRKCDRELFGLFDPDNPLPPLDELIENPFI